jgi:hypothetical protein
MGKEFVYIVNHNNKIIGEFLINKNFKGNVINLSINSEYISFKLEHITLDNDTPEGITYKCIRTDFATAQEIMKTLN